MQEKRASVGPVLAAQGAYYVGTGVWAVVHRRSFEAISGPKTDYWLVRTVGLLAAAIGSALLVASRDDRPSPEAVALAAGAGASFAAVDVLYVVRRRISPVYLGDAAVHLALAWAALTRRRSAGDRY
jgi:hypothetical protein